MAIKRIASTLFAATLVFGTIRAAAAAPLPIDLPALRSYVEIEGVHFSPSGKQLVIGVNRQNFAANRYEYHLEVFDLTTRRSRTITGILHGLSQERWSPDGTSVAYLADSVGGDETSQIFIVRAQGSAPRQLTHTPRDVQSFEWRPDGSAIAYATTDAPANEAAIRAGRDAFEVGDQDYLRTSKPTSSHIWLQPIGGGAPRRLTSGSWSLPNGELIIPLPAVAPMPFFSWAPDGKSIVLARMASAYNSDAVGTITQVLDVRTGALRTLTSHKRLEAGGVFSPDSAHIAYAYARDGDPLAEAEIMITPASGGDGVDATRALDVNAMGGLWVSEHRVLVQAFQGWRCRLFVAADDGATTRLDTGAVDSVPAMLDATQGGRIAFAGSEPQRPTEIYYMASPTSAPVRLTNYNATLAARAQSKVQGISWQGPDGFTETGVLYYPPNFVAGKKYPLVLQIHGGPTEASIASWRDTDWAGLPQYMAAHGYIVFSPNYRGSDGQGNAYQVAIFNDAGDGPGRDVMAGVDAVKQLGIVDENRIAVSGWSYGGYMTQWLITHYDVWKAAVAGAGPADAFMDYSTSDYNVLGGLYFGGSPWDSPALLAAYRAQSPLTYADRVTAPTLLISDLYDVRVPAIHSFEFFHALRALHKPVSFVVYPVTEHYPGDPVRSEDIYRRWVAWLDRYLK
jgi:dipeptidyl aminopeptidase/acylaminoacyl peptidase